MDQIGEGGRNVHEIEKSRKRLEVEEAESALEQEENKVLRGQLELSQVRQEIDRRIQEKEEEFENTRKNHQRCLDSMQASLEAEAKGRAEAMRMKKSSRTHARTTSGAWTRCRLPWRRRPRVAPR